MSDLKPGPKWPGMRTEPREFERLAAAPKPNEDKLGAVFCDSNEPEEGLSTGSADPVGVWPVERSLDLSSAQVEGWVVGFPVVDGVADSGWQTCEGGRLRLVVRVAACPEQREWVRAMAHGGAYAKEVLE